MISNETLHRAVSDGLLSAEQADRLRALEAARAPIDEVPQDEERLRFVTGFSDIFVAIGLFLFLGALAYFLDKISPGAAVLGMAVGTWGLAEFFTRRRRMALPSILLLVGWVGAVFQLSVLILGALPFFSELARAAIVAGPIAAAAAWLHFRRFGVPITPAAGAGALVAMLAGLLFAIAPKAAEVVLPFLMALCGLILFVVALRLDRQDPARETRLTDIAFWLHLLAGPLIVHPVMFYSGAMSDDSNPVVTIALFLLLALVALAADRRAILVSSLIYAGFAIGYLARGRGMAESATAAFSMFVLGAVILLLSAGWRSIRHAVMALLPRRWAAWFPRET